MSTAREPIPPFVPADFVKSAQTLADRARRMVVSYTLLGIVVGLFVGKLLAGMWGGNADLVVSVVAGLIGFVIGEERAFELRLRAQTLLCLASIEDSVRRI